MAGESQIQRGAHPLNPNAPRTLVKAAIEDIAERTGISRAEVRKVFKQTLLDGVHFQERMLQERTHKEGMHNPVKKEVQQESSTVHPPGSLPKTSPITPIKSKGAIEMFCWNDGVASTVFMTLVGGPNPIP